MHFPPLIAHYENQHRSISFHVTFRYMLYFSCLFLIVVLLDSNVTGKKIENAIAFLLSTPIRSFPRQLL